MMDSRELSEWQAYEKFNGPIDEDWRDDTLSEIHELLQGIYHVTVAANSKSGASEDSKPQRKIRPGEIWAEYKRRRDKGVL